jgi:SET domain-containing protein
MYQVHPTVFETFALELPATEALEIREVEGKGRGVFAKRPFEAGELIERAAVLVLNADEEPTHPGQTLYHYVFDWGTGYCALALGYGSLYNHSYQPNCYYLKNKEGKSIDFLALRNIEIGEELLINYNRDPHCQNPLWFDIH